MALPDSAFRIPAAGRLSRPLKAVIWSAFLLRCGQSCAAVIIGFYLAFLGSQGQPLTAIIGGLLLSSSYAVELFVAPVMGALSDRWGRKAFIVAGPLVGLLAIQIYPITGILAVLFLARGLEGVAAAALAPATLGFLGDNTEPLTPEAGNDHLRGRAMAYFEIATLVGIGAGYALGGVLWQQLGLRAFPAAGVFYVLSAVVAWKWAEGHQVRRERWSGLGSYFAVIRHPRVLRFAPAWVCVTAVIGLWFNNIVFQLAGPHRHGQLLTGEMSGNQVSIILGLFTFTLIVGTFVWATVFSRVPDKTTIMLIALGGMFIVCFDLLALNHGGERTAWLFVLLPVLALAVGIESGFTPAALTYLADVTEDFQADRGAIMGLYSVFLSIGEVTGGAAGGSFAHAWGIDGMIFLTLLLGTAALSTVVLLRRSDASYRRLGATSLLAGL